ncbi:hypothetical protein ACFL5Q_03125 [Planctomycetota bacterium]
MKSSNTPARRKSRGSRRRPILDRRELLTRLDKVEYDGGPAISKDELEKLQLVDTLLMLADVSHQTDYALCGEVARRLLGHRPDPTDEEDEFA